VNHELHGAGSRPLPAAKDVRCPSKPSAWSSAGWLVSRRRSPEARDLCPAGFVWLESHRSRTSARRGGQLSASLSGHLAEHGQRRRWHARHCLAPDWSESPRARSTPGLRRHRCRAVVVPHLRDRIGDPAYFTSAAVSVSDLLNSPRRSLDIPATRSWASTPLRRWSSERCRECGIHWTGSFSPRRAPLNLVSWAAEALDGHDGERVWDW